MKAGNRIYLEQSDIPDSVPVFPLAGALLLPGGQMPLNIFEPRYLAMLDAAMAGERLIGMIQPSGSDAPLKKGSVPDLCPVGCLGRITSYSETGDGRYLMTLSGVCRFDVLSEVNDDASPFRQCRIRPWTSDFRSENEAKAVDREALLKSFRAYLDANNLEADWPSVERASTESLVTALSMMSPYSPAEKQALLEAGDLKTRAETLIAITEIALARASDDHGRILQ